MVRRPGGGSIADSETAPWTVKSSDSWPDWKKTQVEFYVSVQAFVPVPSFRPGASVHDCQQSVYGFVLHCTVL